MATIGEIADDFKGILQNIENSTATTATNTSHILTALATLQSVTQAGFTNLAQGLAVSIQLAVQHNVLLANNNKQNDVIICWLANIANVLCDMKRNSDVTVSELQHLSSSVNHLNALLSLAHAREALELANQAALKKQLDECCAKEPPPLTPCFRPCETPRVTDVTPVTPTWQPISFPGK